jgi:hypothetical protein
MRRSLVREKLNRNSKGSSMKGRRTARIDFKCQSTFDALNVLDIVCRFVATRINMIVDNLDPGPAAVFTEVSRSRIVQITEVYARTYLQAHLLSTSL